MNQLYNQVSGHIVGYIGFITNNMANYLNAVYVGSDTYVARQLKFNGKGLRLGRGTHTDPLSRIQCHCVARLMRAAVGGGTYLGYPA